LGAHLVENQIDIELSTPFLDVDAFRRALSLDLYKVTHQHYLNEWKLVNRLLASTQVDGPDDPDGWGKRLSIMEACMDDRERVWKRRCVA